MKFIETLQSRGFIAQSTDLDALERQLDIPSGMYVGFDPTADSLHVGHLLPLKMAELFAQNGHHCTILLGTATAQIGDPTGKGATRRMLTEAEVFANSEAIHQQINLIVRSKAPKNSMSFVSNRDYMGDMMRFITEIAPHFSVNEFVKRRTFADRLQNEDHLSMMEFMYPMLQARDWLILFQLYNCPIQVAGLDQWTNCCAGRDLIAKKLSKEAHIICTPLLSVNGMKMGKTSDGQVIWLDPEKTKPFEMWQFFRNLPDDSVPQLARLFTDLDLNAIDVWSQNDINILKIRLATDVVEFVHGKDVAIECQNMALALFVEKRLDVDSLPQVQVEFPVSVADAFVKTELCASRSDVKRAIKNKGLKIDGVLVESFDQMITAKAILAHGKKMVALV